MESRQRQIAWMAGVLVVLWGLIFLIDPPEAEDPDRLDLSDWDLSQLQKMELEGPAGRIVAERRSATDWALLEPEARRGDPAALEEVAGLLARLEGSEVLQGVSPEDFGLEPPLARVQLTLEGAEALLFELGNQTPVGSRSYARLGDGGVRIIQGQPQELLSQPAASFRDHRLLHQPASSMTEISLQAAAAVSLRGWTAQREGGRWALEDGRPLGAALMQGWLAGLEALEVERWAAQTGPLVEQATLLISGSEGDASLQLGQDEQQQWWVTGDEGDWGLLSSLESLLPPLDELLEARLLPYALEELESVSVTLGERELSYRRSLESGWSRGEEPLSEQGERDWIAWALGVQADWSAETAPDSWSPSGSLLVELNSEPPLQLELGPPVAESDPPSLWARQGSEGPIFQLALADLERLFELAP